MFEFLKGHVGKAQRSLKHWTGLDAGVQAVLAVGDVVTGTVMSSGPSSGWEVHRGVEYRFYSEGRHLLAKFTSRTFSEVTVCLTCNCQTVKVRGTRTGRSDLICSLLTCDS